MKRNDRSSRLMLWLIVALTIVAVLVNLPTLEFLGIKKQLTFRKGLDLAGGTSLTYKADMSEIDEDKKIDALNAARAVIERRIDLFGVAEPLIQTAIGVNDYRIIVELPGVDITQAKEIIGTTAQLSFWETTASSSAIFIQSPKDLETLLATQAAYPLSVVQFLGTYPLKTDLAGSEISYTSVGFDSNTGNPQVQLDFTKEGGEKFAEITKRNVDKKVAIVLDDVVLEAPRVNQPILEGRAVITGGFTTDSAKALSTQLNAGALPVPLVLLQEYAVDATLGGDSLSKSIFAGFLGFVAIVIFMIVIYGRLGFMASLALSLYSLLILSIFKLSNLTPYGITITLSGIAGFILSMGMAVDANILIFERMKEEIRLGKSKDTALSMGFSRAWSSIRDSNISTLITCFVLYHFGTGIVRGFALVLAIGVLASMFSAIVVTRTLLRMIYRG